MSSGLTETITIQNNKSLINEWEGQLLALSMQKRLIHKHSTDKISEIHTRYSAQKEVIKNKIANLENKGSNSEYQELMMELTELETAENEEIKTQENELEDREADIEVQMDSLQTRKEAAEKDNEGFEEMRKENIENSFGYFKT